MYESGRQEEADYFGGSGGQSPPVKIKFDLFKGVQDLPGIARCHITSSASLPSSPASFSALFAAFSAFLYIHGH
jgi:hypothetical protein